MFNKEEYQKRARERSQQWRKDNPEYSKQYNKRRRIMNPDGRKQYYLDNKKRMLEQNRQYYKDNKERILKNQKQRRGVNPEHQRLSNLKCKYGLSHEDWVKMWVGQDGDCAICGEPFAQHSDAYVDHNHNTGKTRGLLCRKCNTGIGYLNDDPRLTVKATEYLLGE